MSDNTDKTEAYSDIAVILPERFPKHLWLPRLCLIAAHAISIISIMVGTYDGNLLIFLLGHAGLILFHMFEHRYVVMTAAECAEVDSSKDKELVVPMAGRFLLHGALLVLAEWARPRSLLVAGELGTALSGALLGPAGCFIHSIAALWFCLPTFRIVIWSNQPPEPPQKPSFWVPLLVLCVNVGLVYTAMQLSRTFLLVTSLLGVSAVIVQLGLTVCRGTWHFIGFLLFLAVAVVAV